MYDIYNLPSNCVQLLGKWMDPWISLWTAKAVQYGWNGGAPWTPTTVLQITVLFHVKQYNFKPFYTGVSVVIDSIPYGNVY